MITARIRKSNKSPKALWLIVERTDSNKISGKDLDSVVEFRSKDSEDSCAYPILTSEVEAIRDACDEWLKVNPVPPEDCICASFWTVRQQHKKACPLWASQERKKR